MVITVVLLVAGLALLVAGGEGAGARGLWEGRASGLSPLVVDLIVVGGQSVVQAADQTACAVRLNDLVIGLR